jgi:hypothetical protein
MLPLSSCDQESRRILTRAGIALVFFQTTIMSIASKLRLMTISNQAIKKQQWLTKLQRRQN